MSDPIPKCLECGMVLSDEQAANYRGQCPYCCEEWHLSWNRKCEKPCYWWEKCNAVEVVVYETD